MGHSYKGGGGKLVTAAAPPQPALTADPSIGGDRVTVTWTGPSLTLNLYESSDGGTTYAVVDTETGAPPLVLVGLNDGDLAFADQSASLSAPGPHSSNVVTLEP